MAYEQYFGYKIGDRNTSWAPHISCSTVLYVCYFEKMFQRIKTICYTSSNLEANIFLKFDQWIIIIDVFMDVINVDKLTLFCRMPTSMYITSPKNQSTTRIDEFFSKLNRWNHDISLFLMFFAQRRFNKRLSYDSYWMKANS